MHYIIVYIAFIVILYSNSMYTSTNLLIKDILKYHVKLLLQFKQNFSSCVINIIIKYYKMYVQHT